MVWKMAVFGGQGRKGLILVTPSLHSTAIYHVVGEGNNRKKIKNEAPRINVVHFPFSRHLPRGERVMIVSASIHLYLLFFS